MTFKSNVKAAAETAAKNLNCLKLRTVRLYTPYWKKGKTYGWMSPMDTDGILVAERTAEGGTKTGTPPTSVKVPPLLVAVLIQSEEATGMTKPNPYGKASVVNVPLGLWVDRVDWVDVLKKDGTKKAKQRPVVTRARLDHVWVMFITRDDLHGVHSNLEVVTTAHRDSWYVSFPPNATAATMAEKIDADVRGFLKGKGRPKAP